MSKEIKDMAYTIGITVLMTLTVISICSIPRLVHGEIKHGNYSFVTEEYKVEKGEDIDSIARKFIIKNTYGERMFKECKEGIIEANWDIVKDGLNAGEILIISYWIKL